MTIISTGITEQDLRDLAGELSISERQPGEFTAAEMAHANGGEADQWRRVLDRAAKDGKLTVRQAGRFKYYRRVSQDSHG